MRMVDKNIFLASRTCLTKGWYLRTGNIPAPLSPAEQFRINTGTAIGQMARSIYPQGVLVNESSNIHNFEKTKQLLIDNNSLIIFEATFIHNNIIARIDILERSNGEWHLIEVKSSIASDNIKDELLDDLTYSTLIANLCGIEAKKMSLLLVSKNYRLGMDTKDFFVLKDCTDDVNNRLADFNSKIQQIADITSKPERPEPAFIYNCKECDFYVEQCLGKSLDNAIFDLPRISKEKFSKLVQDKIYSINKIPPDFDLTPAQEIVWTAISNNEPFIDKEKLRALLSEIIFPAYYLDFESVATAIPLYKNIRPYQTIVTQYSIHRFSDLEVAGEHFEYLSDYTKDDRRTLAEKLLLDIGKTGSVIVYHAQAEKFFIKSLADAFPDLAKDLNAITNRIVDLEKILKATYYHPKFHGSYSIKDVLPVLVPAMNYKELAIGNGDNAIVAFAELARGKYSASSAEIVKKDLLLYCKQDTQAMVSIHQKLLELAA